MTIPGDNGSFGDPGSNPYMQAGTSVTRSGVVDLSANVAPYQAAMGQAQASTNALGASVGGVLTKVDNLFKSAGRKLEIFGAADAASLTAGVASVGQLQQQMGSLSATAAVNRTSMTAYSRAVDNTFSKFPSHRSDVVALVTELGNLSVKSRDIEQVASSVTKLGAATGEAIPALTQDLVQLDRQMGVADSSTGKMANSLLTVSKNAGVSATGVLQFANSIAPISRQAHISESAVLGISTAFSKAGADGFVAANTFNSIVNDITTLTRTGSPELSKYANFIGVTVSQFRKMPAKDQITGIFDAISKGGPQALNFVNELGLGTRALSAVQAVAQSGGLSKYINIAGASAGNTKNLDRGSAAAMNGLNDGVAQARNQLTRLADMIAGPLLTPVTALVHGFTDFLKVVNVVVHALGPIPAILGAVATVLAPLAGFALSHAGAVAGIAGVRMLMNSGPKAAFLTGREGGTLRQGALLREQVGYRLGGLFSPAGSASAPNRGLAAMARTGAFGLVRAGGALPQWYMNSQSRFLDDSRRYGLSRSAYGPARPGVRDNLRNFGTNVRADAANGGLGRAVGRQALGVAGATARFGASTVMAGGSAMASVAGRAGGMVGSALTSPWMLPAMLAMGGASSLWGSLQDKAARHGVNELTDNLDPIKHYNDALGIATTKLADFSVKVDGASTSVAGKTSTATSFAAVRQGPSQAAVSTYQNKGSSDPNVSALRKGDVRGARALMQSYGFTDPRQLDLFGQNLLGAGYSQQDVTKVLGSYRPGGEVDWRGLASSAAHANSNGMFSQNASSKSNKLNAAALTTLSTQFQTDKATHSTAYMDTHMLRSSLSFLGDEARLGNGSGSREEALNNALATLTNGSSTEFGDASARMASRTGRDEAKLIDPKASRRTRDRTIMKLLSDTGSGRAWLNTLASGMGITGRDAYKRIDPTRLDGILSRTAGQVSEAQQTAAATSGPLGRFVTTDPSIIAAGGAKFNDPVAVQAATEKLAARATATTGNFSAAAGELMKLSDTMGGAQSATGRLIASAADWARTLQGFQMPYMSRNQKTMTLAQNYQADNAAAHVTGASDATKAKAFASRQALEAQRADNNQYYISMYEQAKQAQVSMARSQEDYQLQTVRSNRNFEIQMLQSEQDYTKQRARTLEDFNTQQARAAQSAAEAIYNPFARVQSQSVENGAMLVGNLRDQNQRIEQQRSQLAQLKKEGLSQQSIDTLKLADPNNAQQVTAIANSVANDPATIRDINRQIKRRQQATVSLTQSEFNQDFRNTVADFKKGLDRSSADYATSHKRAVDAQRIALSDMSTDFRTMVRRTGEDLTTSMTELYGNFASKYAKTLASINKSIAKFAPAAAATLNQIVNDAMGGIGSGGTGSSGGAVGALGSATNPITTPGTIGINDKGIVGKYDGRGKFHPTGTGTGPNGGSTVGLKHVAPPGTGSDAVYRWLTSAGWPAGAQKTRIMHAIVMAESGGNPRSHNPNASTGDNSYGLAQINMIGSMGPARLREYGLHSNEDLYNPVTNLRIACEISGGGSHFGDWSTYNRGDYMRFMATGGTVTRPTRIMAGENGPETVLPLNNRGADFMMGFYDRVSMMLATRMNTAGRGVPGTGASVQAHTHYEDHRTVYTGDIAVKADDGAEFERKMMERARLKRLSQPAHTGS